MKKKIGAVLMAGLMVCTMTAGLAFTAGCGGSKKKAEFVMPEGGFDTSKKVTIRFYHTMNQTIRQTLQDSIAEFNEMFPNIIVDEQQVGGYDDVRDQITKDIMAGTQPNLAYCYPDHVAKFNMSDAVLSLNGFLVDGEYKDMTVTDKLGNTTSLGFDQAQTDAFIKGYYQEGFEFGDGSKMYTLPFSKSTEVLYYNKTVFNELGLTPPRTWAEMEAVCATLKEKYPKSIPLGYDSEANWFITMCEQYKTSYTSSDPDSGYFLFDNAENHAFVKMLKGWYDKGYFTTERIYEKYTSNLFKTGTDSFMCIGSSAGAKNQLPKKTNGKYEFDIGITPIPQAKQTTDPNGADYDANYKGKVISQGPSVCIFKQDDPQEVLASWLLAKYLTTDIGFQAQFSSQSGYVPVIETVNQNPQYAEDLASADGGDRIAFLSAKVCLEQKDLYYTSPAFDGSSEARDQVGYLMQNVFTKKSTYTVGSSEWSTFVDTTINEAFKAALEECKYYASLD